MLIVHQEVKEMLHHSEEMMIEELGEDLEVVVLVIEMMIIVRQIIPHGEEMVHHQDVFPLRDNRGVQLDVMDLGIVILTIHLEIEWMAHLETEAGKIEVQEDQQEEEKMILMNLQIGEDVALLHQGVHDRLIDIDRDHLDEHLLQVVEVPLPEEDHPWEGRVPRLAVEALLGDVDLLWARGVHQEMHGEEMEPLHHVKITLNVEDLMMDLGNVVDHHPEMMNGGVETEVHRGVMVTTLVGAITIIEVHPMTAGGAHHEKMIETVHLHRDKIDTHRKEKTMVFGLL